MKRVLTVFVLGTFIFSTSILAGCEKKDKLSISSKEKIENINLPKEKNQAIDLDIYFDASENDKSTEIAKEERLIQKEELIGEIIMQELIKGPSSAGKLKPVLPKDTKLLSFSIKDGIAYVNLSREAKVKMPQAKEETCLKSIAASLTQLNSVKTIKILVESQDVDTLGGNYNISKPFGKDDIDARKK